MLTLESKPVLPLIVIESREENQSIILFGLFDPISIDLFNVLDFKGINLKIFLAPPRYNFSEWNLSVIEDLVSFNIETKNKAYIFSGYIVISV